MTKEKVIRLLGFTAFSAVMLGSGFLSGSIFGYIRSALDNRVKQITSLCDQIDALNQSSDPDYLKARNLCERLRENNSLSFLGRIFDPQ
jgi:hypothetical protein